MVAHATIKAIKCEVANAVFEEYRNHQPVHGYVQG